jgi:hypothetical protein
MVTALPHNPRERVVKAWLRALHARCNVNALEAQHDAYAENLFDMVGNFGRDHFTQESYRWVASECPKGAPNGAQVIALLTQWGRDHGLQTMGSEARAYVALFDRRWNDGADKDTIISIAHRHYPREAWLEIRRKYALPDPDQRETMTDEQRAAMREKVRVVLDEMKANMAAREQGKPLPFPPPLTDIADENTTEDPREAARTGKRYRPVYRGRQ